MATTTRDPDKTPEKKMKITEASSYDPNLLSLPDEVLVRIMSFLPETRDWIKLRYVSQQLRNICETPSLWREFVWPDYDAREGKCLENAMKTCGLHVRRLAFHLAFHHLNQLRKPGVLTSSQAAFKSVEIAKLLSKVLHYCSNLTYLSLPALYDLNLHVGDSDKQLREAIQEIRNLQMLTIHCHPDSIEPYLNLKTTLKELTIHTLFRHQKDIEAFQNWMVNAFTPPNLNIIICKGSPHATMFKFRDFLVPTWPEWNSQIPAGRVACLRLYSSYKEAPLNLFQNMPVFQIQYGEGAVLPFMQGYSIDVPEWLVLTDCDGGGKIMCKAKVYHDVSFAAYDINQSQMDNKLTNLTELDLSDCNLDVKQIVLSCPHLQRLSLNNNKSLRLDDLQAIATCCCNLQGLDLINTATPDIHFCMKVWEILSGMKLTHLRIDASLFGSQVMNIDDIQLKQLIALFQQCTDLRALELADFSKTNNDYKLLSHFPALEYCRLNHSHQSSCVQDIITTCEKLKYFYCSCIALSSLSSTYNNNLQQLCISSEAASVGADFMDLVSAHGGLVHVAFSVCSISGEGITALIKNSPNLLTFVALHNEKKRKEKYFESLSASLGKMFAQRKLFTSGFSLIRYLRQDDPDDYIDFLSLWPSEFVRLFRRPGSRHC